MESKFIIEGGKPLAGEVIIQGSKNTALPLIAASLLTDEQVVLERVPAIRDVETMLAIAEKLGAKVERDIKQGWVTIRARAIHSFEPDEALSRRLRGSILFAGSLLGRLRNATLSHPGGDAIGVRPLQTHFRALEGLGVKIENSELIRMDGSAIRGAEITLEESSVTATENAILAAVLAPGKTIIHLPACEPHVQELIALLRKMGADIQWRDVLILEIEGVRRLHGAIHTINADELEISSFSALAAATGSEITLRGVDCRYLEAMLLQLGKMGVNVLLNGDSLAIGRPRLPYQAFRIQSGLYPKLGSDHLPPFAVLATQAEGESLIHDWLYEGRLGYIAELQKMGADAKILDQHRAVITGPAKLSGCDMASLDIRSGMTLLIAALAAEGRSTISDIGHIDRGYERIDERLRELGADIKRINLRDDL